MQEEYRERFLSTSSQYSLLMNRRNSLDSFNNQIIEEWGKGIRSDSEFIQNFKTLDLEEVIQAIGGFGLYQKILTFFTFLFFFFNNVFFYALAFWYYQPTFLCHDGSGNYSPCTKLKACSTKDYRLEFDRESIITQFNLECSNVEQLTTQWIFISIGAMSLITNILGDIWGRKYLFFILNFFGYFVGGIFGYFGWKLWHLTLANFLILNAMNCSFTIALTIHAESLPNEERQNLGMYISFFISLGGFLFCMSQYFVKDYRFIYLIALIFQIFILPYCFWVKETIYFLQEQLNVRKTIHNVLYIHNFNKVNNLLELKKLFLIPMDPDLLVKTTKEISYKRQGYNVITSMIRNVDLFFLKTLILVIFLSTHLEGLEQYIPVILQYLGLDDINVNGTLIAISEFIGSLVTVFFCQGKRRIFVFRLCLLLHILAALLVFIFSKSLSDLTEYQQYFTTLMVCLIRVINSFGYFMFMVYLVEVFDTKNRMLGVALSQTLNFFIFPVWLFFKEKLIDFHLNPIIAVIPFALIALFSTVFLEETLNKQLNQIQKLNFILQYICLQNNYKCRMINQQKPVNISVNLIPLIILTKFN